MNTKILIAATAAVMLAGVGAADAAYKHKRHKVARHHAPVVYGPVAPADPYAAFYHRGPRPPWGAPQQCFTDEGYGRYWPCGAGPSSIN